LELKRINMPLKLISNRVTRTYTGGELIDKFLGNNNPKDNNKPEVWIGSIIEAKNEEKSKTNEGLSYVEVFGDKYLLKDVIEKNAEFFLGEKHLKKYGMNTALLVKMLDSSERLTIQVHPTQIKAKDLFNSKFGKTEAWYILDTRKIEDETPYILLGFKPEITKTKWKNLFKKQDIKGMINSLNKINVKPGEVYLVESGVPHAIGPGCFLIEIQEPTDYTIRVEKTTPSNKKISDELCHQGIGFEKMFDCFEYHGYNKTQIIKKWRKNKLNNINIKENIETVLIDYEDTPHFKMKLYDIFDTYKLYNKKEQFSILTIISGKGKILWNDQVINLKRGESFFLPAKINDIKIINKSDKNSISLLRCYPPSI